MQLFPRFLIITMTIRESLISFRSRHATRRRRDERGQAFVELVMTTGFLVAIAIVLNKLFRPVVIDAFERIATALSAVGP